MIYIFLRNALRMFDIEQTRPVITQEQWQTIFILQMLCSVMNLIYLAKCFNNDRTRTALLYCLSLIFAFGILCGIVGKSIFTDSKYLKQRFFYQILLGTLLFLLSVYFLQRVNNQFLEEVYLKLKNKEEYKFMIDRLEHSILIKNRH